MADVYCLSTVHSALVYCLSTVHSVLVLPHPWLPLILPLQSGAFALMPFAPLLPPPRFCVAKATLLVQANRSGSVISLVLPPQAMKETACHVQSHVTPVGLHSSNVSKVLFQSAHNQCCDARMYVERQRCLSASCSTNPLLAGTLLQVDRHFASS